MEVKFKGKQKLLVATHRKNIHFSQTRPEIAFAVRLAYAL